MTPATLLDVARAPFAGGRPRQAPSHPTVRRSRLVSALANGPSFAVLVAPAGFGKSTLLSEWSAQDPRPFAWVTLDARHNDPRALLRSVSLAVDAASASTADRRIVLVLDDIHVLHSESARDTISAIAAQLPEEIAVALASRTEPPVRVARLRAQGLVTELRHGDLAMTRAEAAALLRIAGLQLGREEVDAVFRKTEGWPVGLSLAALSLRDQPVPSTAVARFSGGERLVAEYLRDEILSDLPDDVRRFVLRTSILDALAAPICDAVLEQPGSAATLEWLRRSNFPLVALDRTAEKYRHHHLLSDMTRAELRRTEPELEASLHRRASAFYAGAGDRERGLQHALAADALRAAGDLVWSGVPSAVEQGSCAVVEHWLTRFDTAQVSADPRLALAAAGTQLVHGHGDLAEHWLTVAAAACTDSAVAGGVAALRAALGNDGLATMDEDAAQASALLSPDDSCQALCGLLRGVAAHLRGSVEAARDELEAGARRAAVSAPHLHALCLAQLALIALDDNDSEGAARLAARARSQVARHGLGDYATSALVLAVSAFVRAQRGRVEEAHGDADAAAALAERLTDLAPWYAAEVRIVLGRAALRLSDVNDARSHLAAARWTVARVAGAVVLQEWLREAEADLDAFTCAASRQLSSLTPAELRILHFLPTHLSFREIGDRTFVSANTVKTQANAVYRKLDVRSRSEAVGRARELGLLDA